MAKIHNVAVFVDGDDAPRSHVSGAACSTVWITPCPGVDMFMPHDTTEAVRYLTALIKTAEDLRQQLATQITAEIK